MKTKKKKLESDLAAADATAATAGAAYETSQKAHKETKDNLDSKNAQIFQTNIILADLRKENNDSKKTLVEIKNKSTADLETKIANLKVLAANRISVVDATATAAKEYKIAGVNSNLKLIKP